MPRTSTSNWRDREIKNSKGPVKCVGAAEEVLGAQRYRQRHLLDDGALLPLGG
jgi:hypothetical protein